MDWISSYRPFGLPYRTGYENCGCCRGAGRQFPICHALSIGSSGGYLAPVTEWRRMDINPSAKLTGILICFLYALFLIGMQDTFYARVPS